MSDQPQPPGRHTLSETQHLMGRLRAAKRGGDQMPTGDMARLADLLTNDIRQLQGALAQAESALRYTQAQVGMYKTMLDGQPRLDRQIEKATPKPTQDGGES